MKATAHSLFFRVVVRRRASKGSAPFGWEVHSGETVVPLHVSTNGYGSMEAAYMAGQSKLTDLMQAKKSVSRRA